MKTIKALVSLALVFTLAGCASIAGDNTRKVRVTSYPKGASIYLDNQRYGVTPATITLPNNIYGGKSVIVKKKGYGEQSAFVNTKFQPVALLDILFWPSIIIDGVTGNLVKIDPATRHLEYKLQKA